MKKIIAVIFTFLIFFVFFSCFVEANDDNLQIYLAEDEMEEIIIDTDQLSGKPWVSFMKVFLESTHNEDIAIRKMTFENFDRNLDSFFYIIYLEKKF